MEGRSYEEGGERGDIAKCLLAWISYSDMSILIVIQTHRCLSIYIQNIIQYLILLNSILVRGLSIIMKVCNYFEMTLT
jgi:hypothetical protein